MEQTELKLRLKKMIVENLMLQTAPEDIADEQSLFGADGLGLDSVDALQLVVGLDKNFGVKIADPAEAKIVLRNVNTMAQAIVEKGKA